MTPVRQEGYQFCQDLCIPCYQTDRQALLRPAAFMDLAQEIAYWAAQQLGFGYESLHIHHTAWVLVRMHVHFARLVHWRDAVTLKTWHKGASGLLYLRDFDLQDAQGPGAVTATSSWVVMDERTRRFVQPESLQSLLQTEAVADAIPEPAPKLVLPLNPADAGDSRSVPGMTGGAHTVVYSDLDINGHTNNARYVAWAMDCLPPEVVTRPLKDLYINLQKETILGDAVRLVRLQDGNCWYVEGRVGEKACFLLKLVY